MKNLIEKLEDRWKITETKFAYATLENLYETTNTLKIGIPMLQEKELNLINLANIYEI